LREWPITSYKDGVSAQTAFNSLPVLTGKNMLQNEAEHSSESHRKEIFLALVTAQDQEIPVAQSRREIAHRFGITEAEVTRIEREGLDNKWPPL
jgi:hypothetical protein